MASPSVLHWHFLGCRVWFWVCFAAVLATSFSAFTRYTLHSTLHTLHFLLHSILDTLRSTLCTLHSTLHTFPLHFTLYTPHSTIPTSHSTHYIPHSTLDFLRTPPMLHLRGRRAAALSIILCNILYTILHLCKFGLGRGILDGGTGRRRAQSRTTIIILTCNGKKHETKTTNHILCFFSSPVLPFFHSFLPFLLCCFLPSFLPFLLPFS